MRKSLYTALVIITCLVTEGNALWDTSDYGTGSGNWAILRCLAAEIKHPTSKRPSELIISSDYGTQFYTKIPYTKEMRQKKVKDILADAEKDDLRNQRMAGQLYIAGIRVHRNLEKARKWLERAAQGGDAEAQLILAQLLRGDYNGSNDEKAVHCGYEVPIDVNRITPNLKKALYWYQKSAENGNVYALYSLGLMHEKGKFLLSFAFPYPKQEPDNEINIETNLIKKDLKKAVEYYKKAADLGLMKAKVHLANMHFIGLGVPENLEKALEIYKEILDEKECPQATLESSDEEIEAYCKSLFNRYKVEKTVEYIELQLKFQYDINEE